MIFSAVLDHFILSSPRWNVLSLFDQNPSNTMVPDVLQDIAYWYNLVNQQLENLINCIKLQYKLQFSTIITSHLRMAKFDYSLVCRKNIYVYKCHVYYWIDITKLKTPFVLSNLKHNLNTVHCIS